MSWTREESERAARKFLLRLQTYDFLSLIMINGRWVKRQKRMHEHINLHCRTLADFVEFRKKKYTHKKRHVLPYAAGCRIDSAIVQWFFSRMQTNDLDAECIQSKRKINNVAIELPIGVHCSRNPSILVFYLFKFYWPLRVAVLKSQLVYVERLVSMQ